MQSRPPPAVPAPGVSGAGVRHRDEGARPQAAHLGTQDARTGQTVRHHDARGIPESIQGSKNPLIILNRTGK